MSDTPLPAESAEADPDRRAFRRAELDRPVMLETEVESKPGKALNVSGGGIAVQTELGLEVGSEVSVYFELPIGYAVEVKAIVVRREEKLIALRFVELPREALVALRSFAKISGLHRLEKLPAT